MSDRAPGQSRYIGSEVYVAKPDEAGRVRLDLHWPPSGTGRYGEANVAHVCDEERAGEIERRWNAHDDLLAACEALVLAYDEARAQCQGAELLASARAAIAKATP